ncbi:MAG TPA: hypothetical protein VHZ75_02715 [Solirubrobacteraceae bacterium]|jgi:hypothetical protein|nr:hypothetical protein [Solirubrobacteraceae bacterium]
MTRRIRSKPAAVLVALLGTTALAACGGSSSGSGGASGDPAASHAAAQKLIAQAIATNPKASSGRIDGTIDLKIKGVPRFKGTTEVTADGAYNLPDGASVPDFTVDVGLTLAGGGIGGTLLLADSKGYIKLGETGYKLPDSISQKIVAPAANADNGLTKTAAMFYINPQNWQEDAHLVGSGTVAGESVQEITAKIRPDRFFADIARLTHLLTLLHVTQATGLPTVLGPKVRAALVRSVTVAKGEVWIGTSDHVLRKAHLTGTIVVAKRDRKLLAGVTGGALDATINVSDVGDPQTITAPTQLGSYSALQLSLSALGEAVRKQARGQ